MPEEKRGDDRSKALEMAITQIEKRFGKGAIMRLGEARARMQVEVIPTGSLALDIALGVGGVPRGRIIELYGQEGSGKTTIALHILAQAQKMGGVVAFIDAEHALDPEYARALGVNVDDLLISQPDTGEQALEIADELVRSGAIDAFVVDSVAALVPRDELEGEMTDQQPGMQARLMSKALRKLAGSISKSRAVAIFVNQVREKIGVMFGSPETTPGGRALKFWSSVRLEVKRAENIKRGGEVTGFRVKVKVVKNKVAPPFREAQFDILFGKGIWRAADVLDTAEALGIVKRTGTWYHYGEMRLGQGRDTAISYLEEHPEAMEEIERKVREAVGFLPLSEEERAPGKAPTEGRPKRRAKAKVAS
ncbi:MAG TPA: recombinase RecA [Armatimonadetes bacterium]|nr:recombinase RecA [Armatimonadota bacterium]